MMPLYFDDGGREEFQNARLTLEMTRLIVRGDIIY
jgi:hypothetical protein